MNVRWPAGRPTRLRRSPAGSAEPARERAVGVVDEVRRWKPDLEENEVAEAVLTLCVLDWMSVDPSSDLFDEPEFAEQVA